MGMFTNIFKNMGGIKSEPSFGQSNEPMFNEDFSDFVNKEYTRRQTERRNFELQWRLNSEFIDGNQFLDINVSTLSIDEIPQKYWHEEREVFNQIATISETRMSKMSAQKPMMKTRPASSDDVDISSSKVTSMLLASTWADQNMDELYEDYISWLELTGTCLWKGIWNTKKGRIVFSGNEQDLLGMGESAEGEQLPAEPGEEKTVEIREGDIETIIVPPQEFYPDSSYRRGLKDCRSIIHAKAYHLDEIEDMYGIRVESEDVDVLTLQKSSSGMGGLGYRSGTSRTNVSKLKDHAVVKEYYEKPTKKYPKGRFIVVAGKKTLHSGEMPYMIGEHGEVDFPFVRCVSIDRAGCFWGKSVIERCIPVQRRYNAVRNRKAEYLNMVAIGQWTAEENSLAEGAELNNAPGNIIYYKKGANRPQMVDYPSLPASFENEENSLMAEFTSISGVSELSRYAQAPDGVKSGVALGIAKEQDDTRLATSVARVANSAIALGKIWLRLYRQFAQEPRMLRYIGGNREADVREWESSDLRSDDVFIENMAALAETPAQRRQMVFDLLGAGLFSRPELSNLTEEGRQKVFQLLEFGHWETGYEDDSSLQRSRARRENRSIMDGQPAAVMDFDDHMKHIEVHNRMRMQAEYEELMKTPTGPMINELMMQHISQHIQLALEAMPKEQAPVPQEKQDPDSSESANGEQA